MRIFIVGGTGSLGKRLAHALAAEHELAIFHRGNTALGLVKGVKEIAGNRNDAAALGQAIADFAPEVVVDIILSSKQQAEALIQMCEPAAQRLVAISSSDVYRAFDVFLGRIDGSIEPTPLMENSRLRDQYYLYKNLDVQNLPPWVTSDYEKIEVEKAIMNAKNLAGTVVRLPMLYGHGDAQKRFHEIFGWQAKDDKIFIDQATFNWRGCWGCIDNVIEAIRLAVVQQQASGQIYHIADLAHMSYGEILTICNEIAGWAGEVHVLRQSDKTLETCLRTTMHCPSLNLGQSMALDTSKIEKQLGFKPIVDPREALLQVLKSFQSTFSTPRAQAK